MAGNFFNKLYPSLKFTDEVKYLEREFNREYLNRSARFTKFSLLVGLAFYAFFGILDALIVPQQKEALWFIRYAIICPFLIFLIILSRFHKLKKYTEFFGVIALIAAGTGISVMVAIAEEPANYSYYAGIILVSILGYGFVRIRFKWASLAGWLNVAIYEIISIFIVDTPREILINNNFFFISANILGMFSCYAVEYYIRKNFLMARLLEKEKKTVNDLNKNLEEMVNERTIELINVNKTLKSEIQARSLAEKERKEMEQKLFHSQKMEALGNFAGGIAHDFNNILTSILGYTELSRNALEEIDRDVGDLKHHLEMISSSGERAAELVSQILSFARRSEKKLEPVRPDLILKEVLRFIRSTMPASIEIRQSISGTSFIMGNGIQLHQIFMNLFTNSSHAMKKTGGVLGVRLADVIVGTRKLIEIEIYDTGEGIPPNKIDMIFEPYFTTKKTGEGTGLGLAVVHGIIESYQGSIRVNSTPGEGTSFIIHLPVSEDRAAGGKEGRTEIPRGDEHILFVDDEPSIADTGRLILSSLGYVVTSMSDSSKALSLFEENPRDFDLVITDMFMPHINGEELSRQIRSLRKEIPIIVCSGYDRDSVLENMELFDYFLKKPFTKAKMAGTVRKVLDKRRGK